MGCVALGHNPLPTSGSVRDGPKTHFGSLGLAVKRQSKPVVAVEAPIQRAADGGDYCDDDKIAIAPFELRHVLEVHPVDAGYR